MAMPSTVAVDDTTTEMLAGLATGDMTCWLKAWNCAQNGKPGAALTLAAARWSRSPPS